MAAEKGVKDELCCLECPVPPTGFRASGAAIANLADSQTQAE